MQNILMSVLIILGVIGFAGIVAYWITPGADKRR